MSKKNIYEDDYKVINNMRSLSLDMINHAKSGHPGICLGASTILYTLYSRFMNIDLNNQNWYNRDRFILSAGHGAPMFYSMLYMLHLISLDDVKHFRKLGGILKGHPELSIPFVDAATGPLGQGIGMSVGMAIAERYLNKTIHKTLINHYTYVLCGDGDLEEGISYEALSLASKLKLNKLILLYDSNNVTLDSDLERTSSEDVITRFKALHFNILVVDGDSVKEIEEAINKCFLSDMPSIIICKTVIGKYSKVEGSNISHGKPLDIEDIMNIKNKLGIPNEEYFLDNDASNYFIKTIQNRMYMKLRNFNRNYNNLKQIDKDQIDMIFNNEITYNFRKNNYEENISLRDISGKILNDIANDFPLLIGGSADLSSSCKTNLSDLGIFDSNNYAGRNIYFGIREHAMGAIINGMALSNLRAFGSTFLVFSDYLRGAIRMSAIMNLPVLYIFTHDSITVGEDGITHEPIEQLASLELIPNLCIYRPCDKNELLACYKDILSNKRPSVLVLPRDNKEYTELSKNVDIKKGAYILKTEKKRKFVTLLANGEEVHLALKVSDILNKNKIDTRIISMPCKKNYLNQKKPHLIPKNNVYAITYGVKEYFYGFTKKVFGLNKFGDTGSKKALLKHFKFTEIDISNKIISEVGDNHE